MKLEDLNLADRAIKIIQKTRFDKSQIPIAIRAGFKCEYCDKDLLESIDAYDSWQIDHIVPDGNNDFDNLALTCKLCNFTKRHSAKDELALCTSREEKIDLAKSLIAKRKIKKEETLALVQELKNLTREFTI
ncbi:hypothetical protein GCM10008090_23150 [Arenicella chitinivorans]|uniref:HNH nuclease domain-containing protein n=1 Tax=Arenicella chitinivorans TaxID=1329800 RepID=A0A918RVR2_9GAMM|nr:HNH endonuclease signature motif containing protein [Arenicella chitinivorans]GHA12842.1 hypothetical protein GCM10008090_23150 [Arenicella chitinivorans]